MSEITNKKPAAQKANNVKNQRFAFFERFFTRKINLVAFCTLAFITFVSVFANVIVGGIFNQAYDTIDLNLLNQQFPNRPPYPPGVGGHLLGTDYILRDVLARTVYGGQVSLTVGYLTALIAIVVGGGLGLLAGYFGGWVDALISSFMQILVNIPIFFLMIILSFIVRFDVLNFALVIGLLSWVGTARLVRGQVIGLKNMEFVEAAKVIGAGNFRVILIHLLPNVLLPMVVVAGFDVGAAIIMEAGLSVLGFGVQIPIASWGKQIAEGTTNWETIPALIALFITLISLYLVANGLRDALDPNLSKRIKAKKTVKVGKLDTVAGEQAK